MKYIPIVTIIASVVIGLYFYPILPDQIATHWGAGGEVNGYMGKFWGIFLMPIISIVLYGILILIPKIDPKKENIEKFRKVFDRFVAVLFVFLFYIYVLSITYNLGNKFNLTVWLLPALSFLFLGIGDLVGQAGPNWTIGIRTPWTLSNEEVWGKTHSLGGKLFKWLAIFPLIGIFLPAPISFWFVFAPIILVSLFLVIYSYFVYKKLNLKV